jgi:hypothetical protein
MSEDMKFRDYRSERNIVEVKMHGRREFGDTALEVDTPLTSNVI